MNATLNAETLLQGLQLLNNNKITEFVSVIHTTDKQMLKLERISENEFNLSIDKHKYGVIDLEDLFKIYLNIENTLTYIVNNSEKTTIDTIEEKYIEKML